MIGSCGNGSRTGSRRMRARVGSRIASPRGSLVMMLGSSPGSASRAPWCRSGGRAAEDVEMLARWHGWCRLAGPAEVDSSATHQRHNGAGSRCLWATRGALDRAPARSNCPT